MTDPTPRRGPLSGVRILDFTHVLSGAFASQILGDMGADIIKVEPPGGEAIRRSGPPFQGGESAYFVSYNRNKRSLVLDLKQPRGLDVARRLLPRMDVFMENFRPGVMERLGLGEDDVRAVKPDIVYASLTAFSRHSSYRDRPGFELIIQALSGIVDVTTPAGGEPAKIQLQVVDMCTGMFLALGVLGALYDRAATGTARRVDT
jgi:crotonobetainyl-CoA:carnitine CoA-transferase CaiB-like acyl-CoA transferase